VVQLGVRKLTNFLHQASRGRKGKEQAEALYAAARESVGIGEGLEAMKCEIGFLVNELEQLEEYIAQLEKRMKVYLQKIPYSRSILSVKGIKTVTAAGLIGEVGDFQAFRSSKELLKMAGLNLYEVSSGIHRGEKHITKRGRSLLRKILYCALLNMVKPGGVMHDTYQAALDRGKSSTSALVMISRKLLKILFALVHNHSVYQEQYSVCQAA
jgi:transposase